MDMNVTPSAESPPGSGIPRSEYVYVTLTAITSGLSIFGGTAICVLHFAFKDLRSPGRQLLLYLAFSDAMLALGNLLGVIWYLYRDSAVIHRSEGYCDFQSAMTIYFSMTSFSWTVIMALCLFTTVVLGKSRFTKTYMAVFHMVSWIPAGIIVIVALCMGVLGTDTTLETASWCWIDPRTPHTLLWQFVTGKFLEIVVYISTVVLYAAIKIFLRRQAAKQIRMVTRKKTRTDVMNEANRKLTFVPLVFIVCRIWGTLRFLIGNFGQSIVNEPYVTWINPLQGIGDSAQGFANFVLYCYFTETIRRRMRRSFLCRNKVGNADTPKDIDSQSAANTTSGRIHTTVTSPGDEPTVPETQDSNVPKISDSGVPETHDSCVSDRSDSAAVDVKSTKYLLPTCVTAHENKDEQFMEALKEKENFAQTNEVQTIDILTENKTKIDNHSQKFNKHVQFTGIKDFTMELPLHRDENYLNT